MKRNSDESAGFSLKPYVPKRLRQKPIEQPAPFVSSTSQTSSLNNQASSSKLEPTLHSQLPSQISFKRKAHTRVVSAVQWNHVNNQVLVSASFDRSLILWDCSTKNVKLSRQVVVHEGAVKDVIWNHDGSSLLTASFDQTSKLIDVETGTARASYKCDDLLTSIILHKNDHNVYLTGTMKSGIFAWDIRQAEPVKRYKSLFGQVQDLLFLPNGKVFLSSAEVIRKNSMDKAIMAWDFDSTAVVSNQIYQEPYTCTKLKLHTNQKHFYAQSAAGYVVIFDVAPPWKMNKYKRFEGHRSSGYHVGFDVSTDGSLIYSGDIDGNVHIYNNYSARLIKKQTVFTGSPCIDIACLIGHKSKFACCSWDGEIAILE